MYTLLGQRRRHSLVPDGPTERWWPLQATTSLPHVANGLELRGMLVQWVKSLDASRKP